MRIRSIKPEFWRSSDISKLSIEDRLLFIGLWSYVDDNGVGIDKLAAIAADLFADDIETDAPETFARVSRGLRKLAEQGRIVRYKVDGTQYLSITNWGKHQRIDKPGKPRFPHYDAENADIRESVARVTENLAPGTGEQGNRGTGEVVLASSSQVTSAPEARDAIVVASRSTTARGPLGDAQKAALRIVSGWEATFANRPPQKHINDVTAEIQKLVNEGIPPGQIAEGLQSWSNGDSYSAKNIPTHVARAGRTTQPKQSTGTQRATQTLELAAQLEMEENQ